MKRLVQLGLSEVLNLSTELICLIDENHSLLDYNFSFLEFFGYSRQELHNVSILQLIHVEDFKKFFSLLESTQDKGVLELRGLRKDGRICWLSLKSIKVDSTVVLLAKDISLQKEFEFELWESNKKLQLILSSGPMSLVSLDSSGDIEMSIGPGHAILGRQENENRNKNFFEVYKGRPDICELARTALNGESVASRIEFQDYEIEILWQPVFDQFGRVHKAIGLSTVLTEKKKQLEQAGNREMANSMPQIVWTALRDGTIDFYSDRWYEFSGFKKGQWSDEGRQQVIHPEDYPRWQETWAQAIRVAESYAIEYRLRDKFGEYRWFLGRAIPSKDNLGQVKKWYGSCTDIHDQKLAQAERERLLVTAQAAEEASKLKSQFVANMSHEIRTPLNGILGMVQIMQQSGLKPEQLEYVQVLVESSNHLRSVVNDILDLSKIESNQLHLDIRKFNLRTLAKGVYSSLNISAQEKNINFRFHIPNDKNLNLIGDSIRIKQVLINLVQNAIKFTNRGSVEVRIKLKSKGKSAQMFVEVEDTGIGIAQEYLMNIFSPFTQADNTITRNFGGTGLGLSICQKLVGMMNGQISVQSSLGKGSLFAFSIPVELADFDVLKTLKSDAQLKSKKKLSILVAEDNEINQKVIQKALKHFGHSCDIASDGNEAIKRLMINEYDLILMDYHMPKMDGLTAIKKIRRLKSNKKLIPILALTADALEGTRKKCIASGANEYISKPIDWNSLFQVIEKLTDAKIPLVDSKIRESLKLQMQPEGSLFLQEITKEYCVNTKSRMEQLSGAIMSDDFDKGFHLAHTIKSSSGQLGALAMQNGAFLLETACRKEDRLAARDLFKKIQKIFSKTLHALENS